MIFNAFDLLKVGDLWQVSGRIRKITAKNEYVVVFDNDWYITKIQINFGNYLEEKISGMKEES